MHYNRQRRSGSLGAPVRSPLATQEQRLRRHFTEGEPDACWHWTGPLNRKGYGVAHLVDRTGTTAHRAVYVLLVGPIPDGLTLDHTCHDPSYCIEGVDCLHRRCVNPRHLEPVTLRENLRRSRPSRAPALALRG